MLGFTVKVHLIDGTYELFRSFFGAPPSSHAGREVGACRGFLASMVRLLRQKDVTHVACAFDHVIESFRNQLFDGYKTGEGIEPALLSQFPLAEDVTRALGIVTWPMIEFEADDALCTGAFRYAQDPRVEEVVLCSPDKDLTQCVQGQRIICWDRMRDKRLDEAGVEEKFGVHPESIPDYLALVGDSADGIPGIPRWGAKSTAQVLAKYPHLENIPKDGSALDAPIRGASTLLGNLHERFDDALLFRNLATLRRDVPLEEPLDALEWRGPNAAALAQLGAVLGLSSEELSTVTGRLDNG
jgi:5'-3' exonuclease